VAESWRLGDEMFGVSMPDAAPLVVLLGAGSGF
jgi:hypothetical protein